MGQKGKTIYFLEVDKQIQQEDFPIVICYNGANHFTGTWVKNPEIVNIKRVDTFISHLESAAAVYQNINWHADTPGIENLKQKCAVLFINTMAVSRVVKAPAGVNPGADVIYPTEAEAAETLGMSQRKHIDKTPAKKRTPPNPSVHSHIDEPLSTTKKRNRHHSSSSSSSTGN